MQGLKFPGDYNMRRRLRRTELTKGESNPHANPHRPLPEATTYNRDFQPPAIYPPRCPTSNQSQNAPK